VCKHVKQGCAGKVVIGEEECCIGFLFLHTRRRAYPTVLQQRYEEACGFRENPLSNRPSTVSLEHPASGSLSSS